MRVCGGRGSVYEFSILNRLDICHMICFNSNIWGTVVFCSLLVYIFAKSLNSPFPFYMELTLFKVREVYFDIKLVTGHFLKCWGSAGPSIIGLVQVAATARGTTSANGSGNSECDTFFLTNWNGFFFLSPSSHVKMLLTLRLTVQICLFWGRGHSSSQGVLLSAAHAATPPYTFWYFSKWQIPLLTGCGTVYYR